MCVCVYLSKTDFYSFADFFNKCKSVFVYLKMIFSELGFVLGISWF